MNFTYNFSKLIKRFIYTKKQAKLLIEQNKRLRKIFEITPNLTILTDGKKIIQANNKFLEFMNSKNIECFHNKYQCISEIFSVQYEYTGTKRKGLPWIEYIAENENHQMAILFDDKENNFLVNAVKYSEKKKDLYIVVFENITEIHNIAYMDQLTSLANRRKINEVMKESILNHIRYKNVFSIILLDVDYFKVINDTYGHIIGDSVLQQIASLLKNSSRNLDLVGRWGGEEFILILKETNLTNARNLARKICLTIANHTFDIQLKLTASFGVAEYSDGESIDELFKRTDKALYKAKNNGRNRVEVSLS